MGKTRMQFVLIIMMMSFGFLLSEVYKIDESSGWTNNGQIQYMSWSATKNFRVGDTIVFEYNKTLHNVVRVTHKNFKACNATSPYSTWATGNDKFHIRKPGHFYFICSMPGHCEAGQKVDIRVYQSPAPSPTPHSPISPLPSQPTHGPTSYSPISPPQNPPAHGQTPESPSPISQPPSPPTHGQTPDSPSPISPPPSPPTHGPTPHNPIPATPSPSEEVLPTAPAPSPSSCSSVYSSLVMWKLVFAFSLCFIIALCN